MRLASYLIPFTAAVAAMGCSSTLSEFRCDSAADCTGEVVGQCEASGHCSFSDSTCASGFRFGKHAGVETDSCVGGMLAPDAMPSVCGNSTVDTGEDCDDGNTMHGDGCSSECTREEQCVLTHNGGSPLTISTARVSDMGALTLVGTAVLPGNAGTGAFDTRSAITACGTHVYAVEQGSESIAQLESGPDGALEHLQDFPQPRVFSVDCLPEHNMLIALSALTETQANLDLFAYAVAEDGSLSELNTLSLNFADGDTFMPSETTPTVVHPITGELWIVGYFRELLGPVGPAGAFRIGVDDSGRAEIVEGPVDIGLADVGNEIAIGNGGRLLVMAGFSGGCTASWTLSENASLPTPEDQLAECGEAFSNGRTAAARTLDPVFYQGHSGSSVRIHEVSEALEFVSETPTSSNQRMRLLYDDSVLFTVGADDGDVTVFAASPDGKTLTKVPQTLSLPVVKIRDLATVYCQ